MATSKAQKKRNRKILWYVILIIFTIIQSIYLSNKED